MSLISATAKRRLERQITLSFWAIALERLVRAAWPLSPIILFYLAAEAFGLFYFLTGLQLLLVQGAAAVGVVVTVVRAARLYTHPTRAEAMARIDTALPGRPLAALDDTLAAGAEDKAAQQVWNAHLQRMAEQAEAAQVSKPDLRLSSRDPYAVRLAAVTMIVAAIFFARGPVFETLAPVGTAQATINTGPSFEGWAVPPAYTGLPTLYLPDLAEQPGAISLPVGSQISVRVYGQTDATLTQTLSDETVALSQRGPGIQDAAFDVSRSGGLVITTSDGEAEWAFTVTPDAAPAIFLLEGPLRGAGGITEMAYEAEDDYAVQSARAELALDLDAVVRRHGLSVEPMPREPLVIDLPMPLTGDRSSFVEVLAEDFSDHPFAGLPVEVRLFVDDAAGQSAESDIVLAPLPARRFFEPLASAVIEQRRDLLWSNVNADRVSRQLRALTHEPEDYDLPDGAYLALRAAIERLDIARDEGAVITRMDEIAELLWDVALLIEEGALSDAQERLRRAQERLSEALENGASDDEIAELMEELREAMNDYMEQMARELMENPDQQQAQNIPPNGPQMDSQDLQDLLDQIQELSEAGEREAAQALLDQLRQMMENMQMALQQGQQGQQQPGQGTQENLQDMLREQQDLADDSFQELQRQFREGQQGQQPQREGQLGQRPQQQGQQQGEQGQQGQQPGQQQGQRQPGQGQGDGQRQPGAPDGPQSLADGLGSLSDRQEALREMLENLRRGLPGPSTEEGQTGREALDRADENMAEARDALEAEDGRGALDAQAEAMENMRQAMRDLAQEAQENSQNQAQAQNGQGDQVGDPNGERDPLGRPTGGEGSIEGRDTRIPDAQELGRSRELAQELRKRAGERQRPAEERDYLERLLDRF
ncbi:MAG: TIGR02302 family protein [Pseudomonadota bacterium]